MATEFLLKEYELCFEQLRYYDTRHNDILKYLFTLTSAVATAQFAIYKILQGTTQGFFACQSFLTIVVFVATLLLFAAMLQNRLYFVYIARQINAIRGYLMVTEAKGFKNNQLYTSIDFPALKPSSVHTFQLLGAASISSLFAGLSAYSVIPAFGAEPCLSGAIIVFLVVGGAESLGGIMYLSDSGQKTADQAIHEESGKNEPENKNSLDRK